jgi:teichuronic acid biosynthesis glycosyltransferase TuaG
MNILNKITKKEPKISIIVPYYRKKFYFRSTFKSITSQSYKNYEIIIIYDDADLSELNFIKKIINYNKNTKILINKKNLGVARSRNRGIKYSTGDYVAFIDSDDIWMKNKLKKQIFFMQNNNLDFSFSSYFITSSNLKILGLVEASNIINHKDLRYSCEIGLSTVVIKKKILKNNYFPNISTKEDYALWIKLSKKITLVGYNKFLTKWRKTKNSLSSNFFLKFKNLYLINRSFFKDNLFFSVFYIFIYSFFYVSKSLSSRAKCLVKLMKERRIFE